jgi:hypothetical protein
MSFAGLSSRSSVARRFWLTEEQKSRSGARSSYQTFVAFIDNLPGWAKSNEGPTTALQILNFARSEVRAALVYTSSLHISIHAGSRAQNPATPAAEFERVCSQSGCTPLLCVDMLIYPGAHGHASISNWLGSSGRAFQVDHPYYSGAGTHFTVRCWRELSDAALAKFE